MNKDKQEFSGFAGDQLKESTKQVEKDLREMKKGNVNQNIFTDGIFKEERATEK